MNQNGGRRLREGSEEESPVNFELEKFFIGIMDFLSILQPDARFVCDQDRRSIVK